MTSLTLDVRPEFVRVIGHVAADHVIYILFLMSFSTVELHLFLNRFVPYLPVCQRWCLIVSKSAQTLHIWELSHWTSVNHNPSVVLVSGAGRGGRVG